MKLIVAVPAVAIVASNTPSPVLATVKIDSSLDAAVVAAITVAESEASAGSVVIVNVLVSPTLPVHVFWLGTIPVAGAKLLGGFFRTLRL
ncbi:hypothetical protein [Enterococcus dongliensis]|uniref:hypothetical protein n=1 Tax=Enterococcus dongliensis TaxID=2559925 RepID=UPI0035E0AB8F